MKNKTWLNWQNENKRKNNRRNNTDIQWKKERRTWESIINRTMILFLPSEPCVLINAFTSQSASNFLYFDFAIYWIERELRAYIEQETFLFSSRTLNKAAFSVRSRSTKHSNADKSQSTTSDKQPVRKQQPSINRVKRVEREWEIERAENWRCCIRYRALAQKRTKENWALYVIQLMIRCIYSSELVISDLPWNSMAIDGFQARPKQSSQIKQCNRSANDVRLVRIWKIWAILMMICWNIHLFFHLFAELSKWSKQQY